MNTKNMKRYYDKVYYCCRFKDDDISNEYSNISVQLGFLNQVLNEPFAITDKERITFYKIYKEYRAWLLECFMDSRDLFSSYFDPFTRKNRKTSNVGPFVAFFGDVSKEQLFFAQTFNTFCCQVLIWASFDQMVIHKMRLAAVRMMVLAGQSFYEEDVTTEETIMKRLIKRKEETSYDD